MDLARRAGITAMGSPRSALVNKFVIKGTKSYLVLRGPNGTDWELYVDGSGALGARPANPVNLERASSFGDDKIPNCALWLRSATDSVLILSREDNGAPYKISVTGVADGIDCVLVVTTTDERADNYNAIGPALNGETRVWVKSALGTAAGLILQLAGVPWKLYVNAAGAIKVEQVA
jgi:hypothetical protein